MAKKYCLVTDITRCDGCGSCILSVKDEYTMNEYPGYCAEQPEEDANWLWLKEVEQGHGMKVKMDYIPVMFPHDRNFDPSEIPDCPEGAVYVRDDGITIIDPEKAKGCKSIYEYFNKKYPGSVFWNEERQLAQIYILDAHRLDEGEKIIRGAEDCPTQAMHWGDLNDPNSDVSKFMAEHPGVVLEDYYHVEGSDNIVKYYKMPKPFITGEIMVCDSVDCVEGAKAELIDDETGETREATTDCFGDFQFKYLRKDGKYTVRGSYPGYKTKEVKVVLDEAKDLDVIVLDK